MGQQGDCEKRLGMPVSPLCDRDTTNIPSSQLGFIEFIVEPTLTELAVLAPKVDDICLRRLRTNKDMWQRRQKEGEASNDPECYSIEAWANLDVENVENVAAALANVADAQMSAKVEEVVGMYMSLQDAPPLERSGVVEAAAPPE